MRLAIVSIAFAGIVCAGCSSRATSTTSSASSGTAPEVEFSFSTPPADIPLESVEAIVRRDMQAGKRRLLGSAIELMFEDSLEIPGLTQEEVDRVKHAGGVEFEWYIHNGHEVTIGEDGHVDMRHQNSKWEFAEKYNRVVYRILVEEEPKQRQPNQALQTTPMTRSIHGKTIEFGDPQRGV